MPTFERVGNEVNLPCDHQSLQIFCPQVLRREILQWQHGVEIARGLLRQDLEFVVGECIFEAVQHQVSLSEGERRLARANGEGGLGGGCHA